jgi:ElaB/YqjD/DUF883 family membrane-anchored ribosome-binding protein
MNQHEQANSPHQHSIAEGAQDLLEATTHAAEEKIDQVTASVAEKIEWARPIAESVKKHPLPAMLIALGVGTILGGLLSRRHGN